MNMFSLSVDGWFYKATIYDDSKAELVYKIYDGLDDSNEELLRDVIKIFEVLGAEIEATRVDSGAKYYYAG